MKQLRFVQGIKDYPILGVLSTFGFIFILVLFLSAYIPPKIVVKSVPVKVLAYVDRINYKNINVFIKGKEINTVISFYKENYPDEYKEIIKFYTVYTKNKEVAQAIIEESLLQNVPINKSFALCERESKFNIHEINKNSSVSIDRGLFQLNTKTFPKLNINDFYDIKINCHYGICHLKELLEAIPDSNLALASYNAGRRRIMEVKSIPYTTALHVFEIKDNETNYDIAFSTLLLPKLKHIEFQDGLFILKKSL